jgi:hypothetical protein
MVAVSIFRNRIELRPVAGILAPSSARTHRRHHGFFGPPTHWPLAIQQRDNRSYFPHGGDQQRDDLLSVWRSRLGPLIKPGDGTADSTTAITVDALVSMKDIRDQPREPRPSSYH